MKKVLALLMALCMVFALCAISASAEEPITLTYAEVNPVEGTVVGDVALAFKDKLEENPKERMRKPKRDDWEDRRDFKKGKGDRRDFRKEGGKNFGRGGKKSFDRNKGGNNKFGKRYFDNNDED